MNVLLTLLIIVQVLSALVMIGLILLQHGKGADAGAAFGGGASASLFGAAGGANFLSRSTAVLATVFFASTLILAYFGNLPNTGGSGSVLSGLVNAPAASAAAPAAPASVPASAAESLVPGAAAVPAVVPASPAASAAVSAASAG